MGQKPPETDHGITTSKSQESTLEQQADFKPRPKKRELWRLTRNISIFIVFFVIGFGSIFLNSPLWGAGASRTSDIGADYPIKNQTSFLLIGVDQIASHPKLESLWFVVYLHDSPHITFLPIYPASLNSQAKATLSPATGLQEDFRLNEQFHPADEFLARLADQYRLSTTKYILVDQFSVIETVNFMGGITIDDQIWDGLYTLDQLPSAEDEPIDALRMQHEVLQALCDHSASQTTDLDLFPLLKLYPSHVKTNLNPSELTRDFTQMFQAEEPISCDFPGLTN